MKKRVVVTGMGLVSCFGSEVKNFYDALLAGKSGIEEISAFDASELPTRIAGQVRDFDIGGYLDRKQARRVDPFIRYAVYAGKRAVEMAKLDLDTVDKTRCGILVSTGMGGMKTFFEGSQTLIEKGYKRISPFFIPHIISNMGGGILAIDLGFEGPNYSLSTACATSNYSFINAANHIRNGDADLMVCGGVEAPIGPIAVAGFIACKALSTRNEDPHGASRPWDKGRDGFVIGEGAGVLCLESLDHALARGAPILCEYLGGAINCDANHITDPKPDGSGVASCMELAIKNAGIEREQINYVNAHATATQVGDLCEIRAVKSFFGDHAKNIKMNGTKSMIGHCLGAAAGLEAIATISAIQTGKVHPTLNLENPEEETAGIDLCQGEAQDLQVNVAASNSFGFGGHNSTVLFGPYANS
ncbi:MAG: beta-ketoacyl-ACP synthase II [Simkaniaceae bacterium]|nr:beta-ketoacyl-ACP synthase II [Simkaniaceae bacterium]